MNILCMIPCRLESERVHHKNIRYLGDKLLVEYIITTAKTVFPPSSIVLNAYESVFERIAARAGIGYYKRLAELSAGHVTNDLFMYDFLKHYDCDWILQAHSTSPFLTESDFMQFLTLINQFHTEVDCMFAVAEHQIGAIYKGKPVNFKRTDRMLLSQDLEPVYTFCNGLMAFQRAAFIKNYERLGYALFAGRPLYVPLTGYSTLDIDTEDDFRLAEGIYETMHRQNTPRYFEWC